MAHPPLKFPLNLDRVFCCDIAPPLSLNPKGIAPSPPGARRPAPITFQAATPLRPEEVVDTTGAGGRSLIQFSL